MIEIRTKVLAVIAARGGSKGLTRKNILDLAGSPLIAWTIKAAKESKFISKVVLSSDNEEIMEVAKRYDCEVPFKRPSYLATDNATSVDVLNHAIEYCPGYDFVILLQPTSPLRTAEDIDAAFELMISLNAKSCVSVCTTLKTPYWMYSLGDDGVLKKLLQTPKDIVNRQNAPETFELNGAIYIIDINYFKNEQSLIPEETVAYVMDRSVSVDIDCQADLDLCETYLTQETYD
tara:strand:- start:579 stop:1277 length:699 start_codon:yes stop_codon:yes gene_type:complete